jgi:3-dehydroquinate synthetase
MTGMKVDRSTSETTGIVLSEGGTTISVKNRFDYSYDIIYAGEALLSAGNSLLHDMIAGRRCLVVTSETVNALYGRQIEDYFRLWFEDDQFRILALPVNENKKNIEAVVNVCREANRFCLGRRSLFVAVGGGVLMDIVGMASSIYMRKLDYVRIPTTLVGQVDAGVGLKTGVDFEGSKNFIGTFHPPAAVLNDFRFLRTLDAEEIRNGLAEITKMAIVADAELFSLLENVSKNIVNYYITGTNVELTQKINIISVMRMLEQLQSDPYEKNLARMVDFGHTFGPFLEMYTGHRIKHGRAVALDMAISAEISYLLGRASAELHDRILKLLVDFGFHLYDNEAFDTERMWQSLDSIVLRRGGKLNLVIPTDIGRAEFLRDKGDLQKEVLNEAITNLRDFNEGGCLK